MPDLSQILLNAQQMQADMAQAQAELAHTEVTGSAGGGLVTAVVSGDGQLKNLRIDPSVVDPQDVETLSDLIVAAVRDANRAAGELSQQTLGSVTGGLTESLSGFGIPGLGEAVMDPDDLYGEDDDAEDDDPEDDDTEGEDTDGEDAEDDGRDAASAAAIRAEDPAKPHTLPGSAGA